MGLKQSENDSELHALAEKLYPSMVIVDEEQADILTRLDEAYCFNDDYFNDSDKKLYVALWFNPNCTLIQQLTAMGISKKYTDYQLKLIGGERCTIAFPMVQSLSILMRISSAVWLRKLKQ